MLAYVFSSLIHLALAPTPAFAAGVDLSTAIKIPVEKYQLPNGLTVILHPDPSVPQINVQTWYRVGSKDEHVGRTGLAHFFEHMMFKGTPRFGLETWAKTLKNAGGEYNAFTTSDFTGYYITAPAEQLPLLLDVESDRMRHLKLDPGDVDREREVVKEERRMRFEDSVEGGVQEEMNALMFKVLPYHWLAIGYMKDLNQATMEDLRAFYKQFYSPNNATLVVAGAIDVPATKALIKKYYAGLPREEITRPAIGVEEVQTKARFAKISREAQSATIAIGYRIPPITDADNYALDLLAIILGQGDSSRLHHELVYSREMALAIEAGSWSQALAGEYLIQANLKSGINPDRAANLIEAEVEKVRERKVSARELQKARNIMMKEYVGGLKRLAGRARLLANYETIFGDYTRIFKDLKKYEEVTPQDIQRVARKYLAPDQRNVITVVPRPAGGKK